jgi:hypothetical protein
MQQEFILEDILKRNKKIPALMKVGLDNRTMNDLVHCH